jgi:RimJ/RimL family protein N-acetyltransferase
MVLPSEGYMESRMAQFNTAAAAILPAGFEPLKYEMADQYHWFRLYANNKTPGYLLYRHRPDANEPWVVAVGGIHSMPGCCGACVITGISVAPRFYRKGLGTLMGKFLLDMGHRYSQAIATILPRTEANVQPMHGLAEKLGFVVYPESRFTNRNTSNHVVTCARPLPA